MMRRIRCCDKYDLFTSSVYMRNSRVPIYCLLLTSDFKDENLEI